MIMEGIVFGWYRFVVALSLLHVVLPMRRVFNLQQELENQGNETGRNQGNETSPTLLEEYPKLFDEIPEDSVIQEGATKTPILHPITPDARGGYVVPLVGECIGVMSWSWSFTPFSVPKFGLGWVRSIDGQETLNEFNESDFVDSRVFEVVLHGWRREVMNVKGVDQLRTFAWSLRRCPEGCRWQESPRGHCRFVGASMPKRAEVTAVHMLPSKPFTDFQSAPAGFMEPAT